MNARCLALGLVISISLPGAAQSADFETRKQAMINEIQVTGSQQKLTTQGLVRIFEIAN